MENTMNDKRLLYILGLAMLGLFLSSACLWPTAATSSDLAGAVTQTWEALSAFGQQATEAPPQPVDESATEEEAAPTMGSTPGPPMMSVSVDTNCRSGPGLLYDYLGALMTYEQAEVLAIGSEPGFWVIENPDNPGTECWVGEQYASIQGDTTGLPIRTPPPTATPEVPDTTPGSISGFVYFDGNNNGHYGDPQDAPIPGIVVALQRGDCLTGTTIQTSTSLVDGSYTFINLPADLYCIRIFNPIYLPHHYEVNLDPGQHVVGINFRTTP
jgi:hypothetical protein